MFRILALAAVAVTSSVLSAKAEMFDPDVGPSQIGPVNVVLKDNAVDACWTNLKEVREYAEEKLRTRGYVLSDDPEAAEIRQTYTISGDETSLDYRLVISVDAFRSTRLPVCVGSAIIFLQRFAILDGVGGFHLAGISNVVSMSTVDGKINDGVIELVQTFVDDM